MPALRPDQCWQSFGTVDIGPALAHIQRLPFKPTNAGSTNPRKCPCFTVPHGVALPIEVASLIDTVTARLGGETHRFLFRKLAPRQGMAPHTDAMLPEEADWRRFHLPLVTDARIIMRWPEDGEELHLAAGTLYEVRVDRVHEIINNADIARIHLQVDQVRATL